MKAEQIIAFIVGAAIGYYLVASYIKSAPVTNIISGAASNLAG